LTDITADLVRDLIAEQFPGWADLPVRPVARQGWDNRTFRLGDDLSVRLPSGPGYAAAVAKEDRCLPGLAPHLPLPIPEPVAVGRPTAAYPHPWSVRRWLPGDTLLDAPDVDRVQLADDLARALTCLHEAPPEGGPAAGRHSFFRGSHPGVYSTEVEAALDLATGVDTDACRAVWAEACASTWDGRLSWFHGDIAPGNLLVIDGRLSALIDFGTCGVGDPACDLQIAWTYFHGSSRRRFREAVGLDADTWARARGWTLWKALIMITGLSGTDTDGAQAANLQQVLADPLH
jgi:aminoglycoside phosphotransferase (APT) family kinase protein